MIDLTPRVFVPGGPLCASQASVKLPGRYRLLFLEKAEVLRVRRPDLAKRYKGLWARHMLSAETGWLLYLAQEWVLQNPSRREDLQAA